MTLSGETHLATVLPVAQIWNMRIPFTATVITVVVNL